MSVIHFQLYVKNLKDSRYSNYIQKLQQIYILTLHGLTSDWSELDPNNSVLLVTVSLSLRLLFNGCYTTEI